MTSGLKTVQVLFEHYGSNANTAYTPIAEYVGQVDLSVEVSRCAYYDDDRQVKIPRYKILDVTIPVWLDATEWAHDEIAWRYAWAMGVDPLWPEAWQRGLLAIGQGKSHLVFACARLLKTKTFRSAFRESLRDQLVAWLDVPLGEHEHRSPFSPRQWEALISHREAAEARRISEGLYGHARYYEGTGVAA
jgi:hypothetical protein